MSEVVNGVVYLLTSPSGKQYVGQSWGYETRMRSYRCGGCKSQRVLYRAIRKHGWNNFTAVKIVQGIQTQEWLGKIETAYIMAFNTMRPYGYNLTTGGEGGKPCAETIDKMSVAKRGENHPLFGKSPSPETRKKQSDANRGERNHNFGKSPSPETRKKQSASQQARFAREKHPMSGKKHSPETRKKQSEANRGKKVSPETRKKQSEANRGRSPWNKGKRGAQVPWNKGMRGLQVSPMKGKTLSPEHRAKLSASAIAAHARKRTAVKTATASLL